MAEGQQDADTERLNANLPEHRRPIIHEHLEELAAYLGVEFSGDVQAEIVLGDLTEAIFQAFFEVQHNDGSDTG